MCTTNRKLETACVGGQPGCLNRDCQRQDASRNVSVKHAMRHNLRDEATGF